jgi:hypothetical protein
MANATYTLNANESDRVVFMDGSTLVDFTVRPGELVQVDLADTDQDAAFDESKYTLAGSSPTLKVKPSA